MALCSFQLFDPSFLECPQSQVFCLQSAPRSQEGHGGGDMCHPVCVHQPRPCRPRDVLIDRRQQIPESKATTREVFNEMPSLPRLCDGSLLLNQYKELTIYLCYTLAEWFNKLFLWNHMQFHGHSLRSTPPTRFNCFPFVREMSHARVSSCATPGATRIKPGYFCLPDPEDYKRKQTLVQIHG